MSEEIYIKNINTNKENSNSLKRKINMISIIRLIVVVLCIFTDFILYKECLINMIIISTLGHIAVFLFLIYRHDVMLKMKKRFDILVKINEDGINRINGNYHEIEDSGEEYLEEEHAYVNDLDIFGKSSLFKLLNTCVTDGGRKELADILKRKIKFNKHQIDERQKAIQELSHKIEWRQRIIVEGRLEQKKSGENISEFIKWNKNCTKDSGSAIVITAGTFIFITILSVLAVLKGILPESFILLDLMVNYIVLKVMSKSLKIQMDLFESIKKIIIPYSRILEIVQDEKFEASYLKSVKKTLISDKKNGKEINCKSAMKKLADILSWIGDSKYNSYYFIINVIFFSDIFLLKKMEKWREENGEYIEQWLNSLYRIDELCSFASFDFEHEKWCYPEISSMDDVEGERIGHPLLNDKCIRNSFKLDEKHKIALITGSNMSGKSTFLRTIGINMVLSYSGTKVCADRFKCGIMNIYTCMRTKDNLEESISSFYAEILRIKMLIEAAKKGEKIFILLDEIFKGTNSQDRHTGASTLIKQIIEYDGMGLVSTHDLELCDLEKENTKIINYNFREFYEGNKIRFDYILRRGKSETRNAVHLMRLAGIDID